MNNDQCGLAILGAKPRFNKVVPVGQLYFPSWDRYEASMRGIFDRQYYTNNGPLLRELESRLESFLGVKHAICVSNATFGLMMAVDALGLSGKVVLPAFTFMASAQALSWAGIQPVFCDVDRLTHQLDVTKLDKFIDKDVTAIMGVNLWGGACNPAALESYAKSKGVKVFFDSAHAFGCRVENKSIGNFGDLEVFSFHATKILSSTEGGCICTNDDALADKLRTMRPSYGAGNSVPIVRVANARMSEAQAAIALLSLEDFPKNRENNLVTFKKYEDGLRQIPGIKLIAPSGVSHSNFQYIVCELEEEIFGISRDRLIEVLNADNVNARRYFYPGVHRTIEYSSAKIPSLPVTDELCAKCIQLPVGALVDLADVAQICEIIGLAQKNSAFINRARSSEHRRPGELDQP